LISAQCRFRGYVAERCLRRDGLARRKIADNAETWEVGGRPGKLSGQRALKRVPVMPTQADFDVAEADLNFALNNYLEKLAKMSALARAMLAAKPQDVPPESGGPNEPPTNPNDPNKGHG
jgi:hypothetical protein